MAGVSQSPIGEFLKLSLIFPIFEEHDQILGRLQDLVSFWKRFPVEIEALLVIEGLKPDQIKTLRNQADSLRAETNIQLRVFDQKKRSGRGPSLLRGLQRATGEILAVGSFDYSIPLGEYFSAFQEFMISPNEKFLLLGNRRGKKKKRQGLKSGLRAFFENVEHEKSKGLQLEDPTSPFWMLRKSDWDQLNIKKMRSWFYTPPILLAARQNQLPIREIEVQTQDHPSSQFRLRDAWK